VAAPSKEDHTIKAETELPKKLKTMPPPMMEYKACHLKCINNLRATIAVHPPPTAENTGAPRVGKAPT
jgi:hypothetical protein